MSQITLLYVPFPSQEEAKNTIRILLKEKHIACGHILLVQSLYFWQNELCEEPEYPAILKTKTNHVDILKERIRELHSYDIPAIIHWNAGVNNAYWTWMQNEVT